MFETVLPMLNLFGRVPVCGLIAHYNAAELPPGPNQVPLLMGRSSENGLRCGASSFSISPRKNLSFSAIWAPGFVRAR